MPTIAVVPHDADSREGHALVERAFGVGAPSRLQVVVDERDLARATAALERDPGIASVTPAQRAGGRALLTAVPRRVRAAASCDRRSTPCAPSSPRARSWAVRPPRTATSSRRSSRGSRWSSASSWASGSCSWSCCCARRSPPPPPSALNLLATAAAFGVARLVFQDGALEGLLGFESQGFVDAWAPIFFFALVFALAMDYTVFLLATIKEAYDRTGDAREAVVEGLAGTGRVINAAAAVMVVVFMTFALAGPLPPKEMGFILAVAVLLDATLVRLLLQPVVLRLLGPRAWWMPAWLDRVLPEVGLSHELPEARAHPGKAQANTRGY